jgi:hypothetical protein
MDQFSSLFGYSLFPIEFTDEERKQLKQLEAKLAIRQPSKTSKTVYYEIPLHTGSMYLHTQPNTRQQIAPPIYFRTFGSSVYFENEKKATTFRNALLNLYRTKVKEEYKKATHEQCKQVCGNPTSCEPRSVGDVIGKGAYGTVYRPKDVSCQSTCPHCVIKKGLSLDGELVIQNASIINQSHATPQIHAIWECDHDPPHMMMDEIEGVTLRKWLSQPHEQKVVDQVAHSLAKTVQKLYKENLIHQDLSLDNVMVQDAQDAQDKQDTHDGLLETWLIDLDTIRKNPVLQEKQEQIRKMKSWFPQIQPSFWENMVKVEKPREESKRKKKRKRVES